MPTDLTGTPTSLGIGTYNVDADAPSGLGFNAAMAQIDALIASRLTTPAGILAGEIPVWNGATWVRSSTLGMAASGISGYPNSLAKFLRGDGAWAFPGLYRKTTSKQVVNTTTETDLLNGEITLGAGVLGTTGVMRLTAWGVGLNNSASSFTSPRWKLKLGATTVLDTNAVTSAVSWGSFNAVRGWRLVAEIANAGATNAQTAAIDGRHTATTTGTASPTDFAVGQGMYAVDNADAQYFFTGANSGLAIDTTVAQALALTMTLPGANASLYMTLLGAVVEII